MIYLFYTLHLLISLFLIMVVLLQQGKGADLSVFGGGGTMTSFGARGAATLLHKLTVWGFVGFIITTLTIGVLQSREAGSTVMSGIEVEAPADDATGGEAAPAGDEGTTEPEAQGLFTADGDEATGGEAGDAEATGGEGEAADPAATTEEPTADAGAADDTSSQQ